jgi:hypothetical protein
METGRDLDARLERKKDTAAVIAQQATSRRIQNGRRSIVLFRHLHVDGGQDEELRIYLRELKNRLRAESIEAMSLAAEVFPEWRSAYRDHIK